MARKKGILIGTYRKTKTVNDLLRYNKNKLDVTKNLDGTFTVYAKRKDAKLRFV